MRSALCKRNMLEKTMLRLLLALLLLPVAAFAAPPAPQPDEAVTALTNMEGRYTIGPWEGALQGNTCLLTNNEPLSFASLELSGQQGQQEIKIDLMPVSISPRHDMPTIMIDGHPYGEMQYRNEMGGGTSTASPEMLSAMTKGIFFSVYDHYKFDLRGFRQAYELFDACLKKALPDHLPYEPIEESDPVAVIGDWQKIILEFGDYHYAAYAILGETGLGLWVHNTDSFVLSVDGFKDVLAPEVATFNGQTVSVVPQEDGVLIPLSAEQLRGLEAGGNLEIKIGEVQKSFAIKDFREVVTALQPFE